MAYFRDCPAVATLVASFERPSLTIRALRSLARSAETANTHVEIYLTDASRTGKTRFLVNKHFPDAKVQRVKPDKFWADAMRYSWKASLHSGAKYLLWLNDDVELFPESLATLLETSARYDNSAIIVGATKGFKSEKVTYGGYFRGGVFSRLTLKRTPVKEFAQEAHLANGNILLIPREVDAAIGGFPKGFGHSMADLYYTGKAHRKKLAVVVAPGILGQCEENSSAGTWLDHKQDFKYRWAHLHSPKGIPLFPWMRICLLLGGVSGPLYFIWPSLRVVFLSLRGMLAHGKKESRFVK